MTSFATAMYEHNRPRPAYVRFEKRPLEQRDEAGNVLYVDADYAIITPPGSPNGTEKLVKEWLPILRKQVKDGMFPGAWLTEYEDAYRRWANDQEPIVNGTDVRNWPSVSPAEAKNLTLLGLVAVEDVADMNAEVMQRLPRGEDGPATARRAPRRDAGPAQPQGCADWGAREQAAGNGA